MGIAANICIFTNDRFNIESVRRDGGEASDEMTTETDAAADHRELPIDGFVPPSDTGAEAEEEEDDEDELGDTDVGPIDDEEDGE